MNEPLNETLDTTNEPLLQIQNLSCERDDRLLIQGLCFEIRPGEVLQIEGPNGSGKTTLIRVLCGLSEDFEGERFWKGQSMRQVEEQFRQQHLYFGHLTGIKHSLTAQENLHWILQLKGHNPVDMEALIDQALAKVGLRGYEDVPVYSLSAGQKRRVALARLFAEPAQLWILDEPFTAIDRQGVKELESLIQAFVQKGGAVLITTHHALELNGIRKLQLGVGGGQWQLIP